MVCCYILTNQHQTSETSLVYTVLASLKNQILLELVTVTAITLYLQMQSGYGLMEYGLEEILVLLDYAKLPSCQSLWLWLPCT